MKNTKNHENYLNPSRLQARLQIYYTELLRINYLDWNPPGRRKRSWTVHQLCETQEEALWAPTSWSRPWLRLRYLFQGRLPSDCHTNRPHTCHYPPPNHCTVSNVSPCPHWRSARFLCHLRHHCSCHVVWPTGMTSSSRCTASCTRRYSTHWDTRHRHCHCDWSSSAGVAVAAGIAEGTDSRTRDPYPRCTCSFDRKVDRRTDHILGSLPVEKCWSFVETFTYDETIYRIVLQVARWLSISKIV